MDLIKKFLDAFHRYFFVAGNLPDAIAVTLHADNFHLLFRNMGSQIMEHLLHFKFLHETVLTRQHLFQRNAIRV